MSSFRRTGRTTRQLKAAPQGAVYVVPTLGALAYTQGLARDLGRDDLHIETASWLSSDRWRGRQLSGVVIDHAVAIAYEHRRAISILTAHRVPVQW